MFRIQGLRNDLSDILLGNTCIHAYIYIYIHFKCKHGLVYAA